MFPALTRPRCGLGMEDEMAGGSVLPDSKSRRFFSVITGWGPGGACAVGGRADDGVLEGGGCRELGMEDARPDGRRGVG